VVREQDAWVSQLRKGVVELVILGLLASGERYGSELVETLSASRELAISGGTVYPLLSRLKKAGLIDSTWRESPVGPPRKYYRLTPRGIRELDEMAAAWASVTKAVNGLMKGVAE
jgi:PadR family transcriptional regulator PadR